MKFAVTARFDADLRRLSAADRAAFVEAARSFSRACDAYIESKGGARWPAGLRVKPLRSVPGVWEMTWSFSGPDGRATWEWVTTPDGPLVRWRRIGDHSVFEAP